MTLTPDRFLIALVFGACAVEVAGRLLGLHEQDRISNQREASLRRRAWRGDFGLEARAHEVCRTRTNWVNVWGFGVVLAVLAVMLVLRSAGVFKP